MSSEWAEQPDGTAAGAGAGANAGNNLDGAPGKILAAQREAMGWTVEQVADQLKLAVRQVVALEAGDSAALPGPAVVRGFVRAYAKIVRLDPAPLVAKIALDTPGPSDASHTSLRHAKPASFSEVRFPSHGKRASLPIVPIVVVIVLVGAAAAAWHFGLVSKLTGRSDTAQASVSTSTASTAVLAPASSVAAPASTTQITTVPAAPSGQTPVAAPNLQNPSVPLISVPPPSAVTPGSPAASSGGAATPATTPAAAAPATTAAAPAGANALVLTAQKDSWIQVKRAKGAPLFSRLVKAGSTETVDVTEPVTLVVGNPAGVTATLRGAAVTLPATANGAVARVELK